MESKTYGKKISVPPKTYELIFTKHQNTISLMEELCEGKEPFQEKEEIIKCLHTGFGMIEQTNLIVPMMEKLIEDIKRLDADRQANKRRSPRRKPQHESFT